MREKMLLYLVLAVLTFNNVLVNSMHIGDDVPVVDFLNDIYESGLKEDDSNRHVNRRAYDSGSEEAWTGRWFPEKVTETPKRAEVDNWTGRWFPEKVTESPRKAEVYNLTDRFPENVTQSPHKAEIDNWISRWFAENVTESPRKVEVENWTGRWLPEKVTPSPHKAEVHNSTERFPEKVTHSPRKAEVDNWTGRWFPENVTESPLAPPEEWTGRWFPPSEKPMVESHPISENNMWQMINSSCDDGKTNLTVDWDGSFLNYTCPDPRSYFVPDYELPNIIEKSLIPKEYRAKHECMQKEITYSTDLPTFGTHRPAWPRYGEYQFCPRQRWLHNLEHGAIVMLYHPCAHPQLVKELKEIVTSCLYRHIITPYTLLPRDRPLALLSWGWALLMPAPDPVGARDFIKQHALKGPEAVSRDGQFSEGLVHPAEIISDIDDSNLCPQVMF